ncbi:unnamed protein product [Caenorhabditis auriculariae]|uniref:Uncharacterized protein n=1 Tax=Caenorhabditis auriculariae TaxID=2777116 RepID=A0A8S1HMZ2_9PELO|nr:unnamed protein product [Caenorhabditis auriculariae]
MMPLKDSSQSLDECENDKDSRKISRRSVGGSDDSVIPSLKPSNTLVINTTRFEPSVERPREPPLQIDRRLFHFDDVDYSAEVCPCRTVGFWLKVFVLLGLFLFIQKLVIVHYKWSKSLGNAREWTWFAFYDGITLLIFVIVYFSRKKAAFKTLTIVMLVESILLLFFVIAFTDSYINLRANDESVVARNLFLLLIVTIFFRFLRHCGLIYYMWKASFPNEHILQQ